jgi:transposase InsO family protein
VAIDDHSRVGFSQKLGEVVAPSCWLHAQLPTPGVRVAQVMTDNGSAYKSRRFAKLLRSPGIRHIRTRPCTPRINGKAERFVQTLQRE